jgi:hypothetical protein
LQIERDTVACFACILRLLIRTRLRLRLCSSVCSVTTMTTTLTVLIAVLTKMVIDQPDSEIAFSCCFTHNQACQREVHLVQGWVYRSSDDLYSWEGSSSCAETLSGDEEGEEDDVAF